MIRRDMRAANGEPAWVLIDQVEHAHVAGDLARFWGGGGYAGLRPRDIVLPTIRRHDDGWMSFDAEPEVDVELGRPYAFTEMPMETAHAIWSRSIDLVADLGPLSQYLVASHFTALRQDGTRSESPPAQRFVETNQARCQRWLDQWQRLDPSHTSRLASVALEHLQLFDAMSLWFCCAELDEAASFACPEGRPVNLRPRGPWQVAVDPWPFTVEQLEIETSGRQVPARHYADTRDLLSESARQVRLHWRLMPANR
jgi:hypothetical protein